MCYIELKNEKYETLEDLKRLLQYILRLDKTAEDSQRVNTITNTLAGCQPAMIPNEYLCDPSSVFHLMLFEVRRRHKGIPQFAKHRIVSFAATDCILPQDVVSLAERIASIYAKNGYITAYGIHADRFNVHIHFAVCAVSFQTQNMFHIQWKSEWKMLVTVTNQWKSEFDEMLQNNIQMRQSREAALYGDDIVRYGSISLTAKGQMNQEQKIKAQIRRENTMGKFDEKVIGYESTKEILRQILDILKRPEVYKRKGISIPRGLLMESDPGLGKSLLASILMEESERKPFVFRKTSQENSFLDELRTVFAMAKEEAPSILLLEDLNLYVESNSPYAPEWACLQACIDDAKDTDLFVIATTNDTRYMPPSLLRPGRFDYVIYLQPPIGENAENIVSYYLRNKDLAEDVLISDIVKAMPKVSCATLETVMNLAALNSVYQGHEHIQKEDITEALLQVVYKLQKTDKETDSTELQKIAVHEAAHAVVGEVLHPGSIGIVTVRGSQGVIGGMANGCATYAQNEEEFLDEVTKTLAGRAGVSLIYGVMDIQASADIEQADKLMDIWQCHFAGGGFVGIESGDNRMSEQRLSYNEAIKSAKTGRTLPKSI